MVTGEALVSLSTARPIQTAIQGIYGRALFRPSDLNNGTPPSIVPAGCTAAAGTAVRTKDRS